MRRDALLHYFRVEVKGDNPVGPGSTFNEGERKLAHQKLLQYAAMVERVSKPPEVHCRHAPPSDNLLPYAVCELRARNLQVQPSDSDTTRNL